MGRSLCLGPLKTKLILLQLNYTALKQINLFSREEHKKEKFIIAFIPLSFPSFLFLYESKTSGEEVRRKAFQTLPSYKPLKVYVGRKDSSASRTMQGLQLLTVLLLLSTQAFGGPVVRGLFLMF